MILYEWVSNSYIKFLQARVRDRVIFTTTINSLLLFVRAQNKQL